MQFWNNSRIWSLDRQGSESVGDWGWERTGLRRMAATRAARAWTRSSLSSLEPRKKGLVGGLDARGHRDPRPSVRAQNFRHWLKDLRFLQHCDGAWFGFQILYIWNERQKKKDKKKRLIKNKINKFCSFFSFPSNLCFESGYLTRNFPVWPSVVCGIGDLWIPAVALLYF